MYYQAPDKSLHYLDDERFVYLLPPESEPVSDARAAELQTPAPVAPSLVTRFQALATLATAGYLPTIRAYIATLSEDDIVRLAWENAAEWERSSPTLAALATMLGLTDAQVDDLFIAASQVSA